MTPGWVAAGGLLALVSAWLVFVWWAAVGRRRGLVDRGHVSRAAAAMRDRSTAPPPPLTDDAGTPETGDPYGTFGTKRGPVIQRAQPPSPSPAYDVPLSRAEAETLALLLMRLVETVQSEALPAALRPPTSQAAVEVTVGTAIGLAALLTSRLARSRAGDV